MKRYFVVLLAAALVAAACSDSGDRTPATSGDALAEGVEADTAAGTLREGQGTDEELYQFRFWGFRDDGSRIQPTVSLGGQEGGKKWVLTARDFPADWTVKVNVFDINGNPVTFAGNSSGTLLSARANADGFTDAFHKPLGEEIRPRYRIRVTAQAAPGTTDVFVDEFTYLGEPQGAQALKLARRGDGTVRAIAQDFPAGWDGDLVKVYVKAPDSTENPWPATLTNGGVDQDDLLILRDLDPGDLIRVIHTPIVEVGSISGGGILEEDRPTVYLYDSPNWDSQAYEFQFSAFLGIEDSQYVPGQQALGLVGDIDEHTSSAMIVPGCSSGPPEDLPDNHSYVCSTPRPVTLYLCSGRADQGPGGTCGRVVVPAGAAAVFISEADLEGAGINNAISSVVWQFGVDDDPGSPPPTVTSVPPEQVDSFDVLMSLGQDELDQFYADIQLPPGEAPVEALPASALPASALPASALPASALPASALPASALPASALPASALPAS